MAEGFVLVAGAVARRASARGVDAASSVAGAGSGLLDSVRVVAERETRRGTAPPTPTATVVRDCDDSEPTPPRTTPPVVRDGDDSEPTTSSTTTTTAASVDDRSRSFDDDRTENTSASSSVRSVATDMSKRLSSPSSEKEKEEPPFVAAAAASYDDEVRARPAPEAVPVTRFARALDLVSLGARLAAGAAAEGVSRLVSGSDGSSSSSSSLLLHDANADLLARRLCRMRGAALKVGQMLSVQDESVLPPALTKALTIVRAGAVAMPEDQLRRCLAEELGDGNDDWERARGVVDLDPIPVAAASLGQVHRATLADGRRVALKVQYPGVADSVDSDLDNVAMLLGATGAAPRGLFLDNIIRVARSELCDECDYVKERAHQERYKRLLELDEQLFVRDRFCVPAVVPELCTKRVLATEFAPGVNVDRVADLDVDERNRVARAVLRLTMLELFRWRFMQTDPNWGNLLYDVGTGETHLVDFGAAIEYSKDFTDAYCRMIRAAAEGDRDGILEHSYDLGFLTGNESDVMIDAHVTSGLTIGEPFRTTGRRYDFGTSRITRRIAEASTPFLKHRLTPPPTEVYSLHRKIAGTYWLCIKLRAEVECRDLLEEMITETES